MVQSHSSRWLHGFAVLTAIVTLGLIGVGGLVTSHGVGLAVPDWPNTYGYNMFLFPISKWVGGIFYEHSHRLMAAFVGLLTTVLAIWLWVPETAGRKRWLGVGAIVFVLVLMGVRAMPVYLVLAGAAVVVIAASIVQIRRNPGTLRWYGIVAFAAVILQGVLGGLRVVALKDEIGIFHALLAQLFFTLLCVIALLTSRWAQARGRLEAGAPRAVALEPGPSGYARRLFFVATLLILFQLILGATMRHQHAGLAISDFPLAHGKLWPAMDAQSVARYNQERFETVALNPITVFQIGLQMTHRITAVIILVAVLLCAGSAWRQFGAKHPVTIFGLAWLSLILTQALLGAATIWSNKAADIATAHVLVGALALALGTLQVVLARSAVLSETSAAREWQIRNSLRVHPSPQPT